VRERFLGSVAEANVEAARKSYASVKPVSHA
jgi:Pyruvate/2-oxoacid:ferredoxin oxidoreductase gamma subunit